VALDDARSARLAAAGAGNNELKLVNLVPGLGVVLSPPPQASIILMTEGGVAKTPNNDFLNDLIT
jgi:hypothetical protein